VCSGSAWVQQRLPVDYGRLSVVGVLIAALTGIASWAFGYPFLTTTFGHIHWPLIGDFELASAMIFDTGVFITVVGATLLMLAQLGRLAQTTYGAIAIHPDLPTNPALKEPN